MARKPNYHFERLERERVKSAKAAAKAAAKRSPDEEAASAETSERRGE
jgi:hypothetical protein